MLQLIIIFVISSFINAQRIYTYTKSSTEEWGKVPFNETDIAPKILLNEADSPGEAPWMTYITYIHVKKGKRFICGGSILNQHHVLTAGHCCRDGVPGTYVVRVGTDLHLNPDCKFEMFDLFGIFCTYYSYDYKVDKTILYPSHRGAEFFNDICIIRVKKHIDFNKYIYQINLPFGNGVDFSRESFEEQELYVTGWGKTKKNGQPSHLLMTALVKVVGLKECQRKWKGYNINNRLICVGGSFTSKTCQGDSGGPLMLMQEGQTYIIGVGVGSRHCTRGYSSDMPGIFVRVDRYRDWIQKTIQQS